MPPSPPPTLNTLPPLKRRPTASSRPISPAKFDLHRCCRPPMPVSSLLVHLSFSLSVSLKITGENHRSKVDQDFTTANAIKSSKSHYHDKSMIKHVDPWARGIQNIKIVRISKNKKQLCKSLKSKQIMSLNHRHRNKKWTVAVGWVPWVTASRSHDPCGSLDRSTAGSSHDLVRVKGWAAWASNLSLWLGEVRRWAVDWFFNF